MNPKNTNSNVISIHTLNKEVEPSSNQRTIGRLKAPKKGENFDFKGHSTIEEGQIPHDNPSSDPTEEDIKHGTRLIEALLFASSTPLTERKLANKIPKHLDMMTLLQNLQMEYKNRGINLVRAGKSWSFRTAEDLSAVLNVEAEVSRKMNRATIETMAIIAYHQPVTRAEIEDIRGVSLSKGTLDTLFEKGWIKPRGRRETPGRPTNWATTDEFLNHFSMEQLTDLPGMEELKAAGLLDSGTALNIYRSRGNLVESDPNLKAAEDISNSSSTLTSEAIPSDEDTLEEADEELEPIKAVDIEVMEPLDTET